MKTVKQFALDNNIMFTDSAASKFQEDMVSDLNKLSQYNPTGLNNIADRFNKSGYNIQLSETHKHAPEHVMFLNDDAHVKKVALALDAVTYDPASNGVAPYFTTVYTNKMIRPIFKKLALNDVTEDWQIGSWGLREVNVPVLGITGQPAVYSDTSGAGPTGLNYTYVRREFILLQQTLNIGDLEQEITSLGKIAVANEKRAALLTSFMQTRNDIGFVGVEGMQLYGMLNDPNLAAFLPFPNGLSGFPQWSKKTFDEIIADIQLMLVDLATRSGAHLQYDTGTINGMPKFLINAAMTMILPPSAGIVLSTKLNALGNYTVLDWLRNNYPNMKVVQSMNYSTALTTEATEGANTYVQIILDEIDGQRSTYNLFNSLYNSHGAVRQLSSIYEKVSMSVGGSIVALPIAVSTGVGC